MVNSASTPSGPNSSTPPSKASATRSSDTAVAARSVTSFTVISNSSPSQPATAGHRVQRTHLTQTFIQAPPRPPKTQIPGNKPKPATTTHPRRRHQPTPAHQPRPAPHPHRMGHPPHLTHPKTPPPHPTTTPRLRFTKPHPPHNPKSPPPPNTNTQQPPRRVGTSAAIQGPQRTGVPIPHRTGNLRRDPVQTVARERHPSSAPRIPVKLQRLGSRTHRHPQRNLRTRPSACQQRPSRSRLPAKRPLRPAPRTHATLGPIPTDRRLRLCDDQTDLTGRNPAHFPGLRVGHH